MTVINVQATPDDVGKALGELVLRVSTEAIARSDRFTIALSGGSLPKILNKGLSSIESAVDFSKWHVYFADERCVPLDHDDSNYKACKEAFLDHVSIPKDQIYTIEAKLTPSDAAKDYQMKLAKIWGGVTPVFDLILLGMGPDGHTCSLFPGHGLLEELSLHVASILDSPKPPPERITLTYPVVNNSMNVAFVATGEGKADLMPHMLGLDAQEPSLPAARVKPVNGTLYWYIDAKAATKVPEGVKSVYSK